MNIGFGFSTYRILQILTTFLIFTKNFQLKLFRILYELSPIKYVYVNV